MAGKIVITRTGYDPELGKHVKDPYLGPNPSLGACRPDVREKLQEGDHLLPHRQAAEREPVCNGRLPGGRDNRCDNRL